MIISSFFLQAGEVADEYELKAAFIERFSRFIEWPPETWSQDKNGIFEIAILGESPFGKKLDVIYARQKIKDKTVKIRYIKTPEEIGNCNILFICPNMSSKVPQILEKIGKKSILTIGQTKGFCEIGVHINFYIAGSKIKFQINDKAAKSSNLKMSHLLLQNATIVNTRGTNE